MAVLADDAPLSFALMSPLPYLISDNVEASKAIDLLPSHAAEIWLTKVERHFDSLSLRGLRQGLCERFVIPRPKARTGTPRKHPGEGLQAAPSQGYRQT